MRTFPDICGQMRTVPTFLFVTLQREKALFRKPTKADKNRQIPTMPNLLFVTLQREINKMRPRVLTMDYINVPMALLQEVKEDPLQWSLVALSVAMKCLSPSSTYIFTSEKKFRGDFHLGYTKTRNLLDAIREGNSLFQMTTCPNGRTIIVARSLKKMYASQKSKARCANCFS